MHIYISGYTENSIAAHGALEADIMLLQKPITPDLFLRRVHEVEEMVRRMANGVAVGGTLFMVGHRPIDPATGAATGAAGQVQVSVEAAIAAINRRRWEVVVAEERPRPVAGTGVDAVIHVRRLS